MSSHEKNFKLKNNRKDKKCNCDVFVLTSMYLHNLFKIFLPFYILASFIID